MTVSVHPVCKSRNPVNSKLAKQLELEAFLTTAVKSGYSNAVMAALV